MYTLHQIVPDFCVLRRRKISLPGSWAGSRRTAMAMVAAVAAFLRNNHKQERHRASSLCNFHVHHIWNVHRWSFVSLFVRHLSRMPRQFVVAGDVKRSAGGVSVTTSWNGHSATYRTGVWHAPANNSIFSAACKRTEWQRQQETTRALWG